MRRLAWMLVAAALVGCSHLDALTAAFPSPPGIVKASAPAP